MTGSRSTADESGTRSATIRTELDAAATVAASVRPDNTPEIDTRVEDGGDGGLDGDELDGDVDDLDADDGHGVVVTTVERETTGGLRTTVDDYVVNLAVAQEVVQVAKRRASTNANADDARANQTQSNADIADADANADDTDNTQP